jgi:hypothetical protein
MTALNYEEELKLRDIRQKHYDAIVSQALEEIEKSLLKPYEGFHHTTFFGAMGINPKHLAIWCFFTKDDDLRNAEETQFTIEVQNAIRESLRKHGYPDTIVPLILVSYATDEDVQRTCGGNYWQYLK